MIVYEASPCWNDPLWLPVRQMLSRQVVCRTGVKVDKSSAQGQRLFTVRLTAGQSRRKFPKHWHVTYVIRLFACSFVHSFLIHQQPGCIRTDSLYQTSDHRTISRLVCSCSSLPLLSPTQTSLIPSTITREPSVLLLHCHTRRIPLRNATIVRG